MGSFNIGNLFSSFSGGSSIFSGDMLSQYASIRNGSYRRLAKAYYSKQTSEKSSAKSTSKDKTDPLEAKKNNAMSKESAELSKSVDALNDSSLWEKKKIKTKDEKTGEEVETEDYDWEKITSAIKSFAEDYNKVVDSAANSSNKDVLYSGSWMTGTTAQNQKMLEKIGITVGKDNKLTVNEEKLKSSDIASVKNLFYGRNSYANKVAAKAATITRAAVGTGSAYTNKGTYTTDYVSALTGGKYSKDI